MLNTVFSFCAVVNNGDRDVIKPKPNPKPQSRRCPTMVTKPKSNPQ